MTETSHEVVELTGGNVRDTDDLYRLYRQEWITVFTASETAVGDDPGAAALEAMEHFEAKFRGRVHEHDVRIVAAGLHPHSARVHLQLRLPNLKGEFKYAYLAERYAEDQGWDDWTIVARNSKDDHDLRGYSVKKLPA